MSDSEPLDLLIASGVNQLNIVVSRAEVEALDVHEATATLRQLLKTPTRVHHFRHRVSVFIDGYNADSRELYCIPEVRAFVTALDAEFPYWFWFLNTRDHSLLTITACCSDLSAFENNATAYLSLGRFSVAGFLASHFEALNRLAGVADIPEETLDEISTSISAYFKFPEL